MRPCGTATKRQGGEGAMSDQTKREEAILSCAQQIQQHCRMIGKANLGDNCCRGCIFNKENGCVLQGCPEEWRLDA